MTEKRKHDQPAGADQSRRPSNGSPASNPSPQEPSGTVENYPRKRIAIAVSVEEDIYHVPECIDILPVQCLPFQEDPL